MRRDEAPWSSLDEKFETVTSERSRGCRADARAQASSVLAPMGTCPSIDLVGGCVQDTWMPLLYARSFEVRCIVWHSPDTAPIRLKPSTQTPRNFSKARIMMRHPLRGRSGMLSGES